MALAHGTHRLGPGDASLQVKTYREGMAARVGHDLVMHVTRWDATVEVGPEGSKVELTADPRSFEVREGLHGVKPLTDKDRREILKNIDEKVLGGQPIAFRCAAVRSVDGGLELDGELTMAGTTRPVSARLDVDGAGNVSGTIPITQSEWGIKPYRGLMGALKVRDDLELVIAARLPAG